MDVAEHERVRGTVSPELLAKRTVLGQRIANRLRELGMSPIFPGYFGTFPGGFAERNPGARTIEQGTWNGLPRPECLDPRTPVFERVAASFYRHKEELFGPALGYKMDLLHEGGNPGDVPVADAARAVQKALAAARPEAVWVILGWQENPRRELLNAVDKSRLLVVDGLSELERIGDREQDWGGTAYAFGTIPNFGGRTTIGAKTHMWADRFTVWRDKPGSALVGTAYMPEAAERDPAAFELFSELAWRDTAVDSTAWFREYADARYGGRDRHAHEAFDALRESAYEISSAEGGRTTRSSRRGPASVRARAPTTPPANPPSRPCSACGPHCAARTPTGTTSRTWDGRCWPTAPGSCSPSSSRPTSAATWPPSAPCPGCGCG